LNAEYVNPFIQGSQKVLISMVGEQPVLGKVFLKKPPYEAQPVAVAISTIGNPEITTVLTMSPFVGCYLASKMMRSPVVVLDDMSKSALCELANMIAGNVATLFSQKGIIVDITTPEYFGGSYPPLTRDTVCIPLIFQEKHIFEIDVCLP
jgi:chemotaxis protein CheX